MPYFGDRKCKVCGEQVTNGAYYGSKLCLSCQQFYFRSVTAMNS